MRAERLQSPQGHTLQGPKLLEQLVSTTGRP